MLCSRLKRITPRSCASSHGGFALVIALGLMAFVLLLATSITSLTRVESAASENQRERVRAEQYAVLALLKAMGDIQRTLGPDRRVSAEAAILDYDVTDESVGAPESGVAQPRWVGVWDTTRPPPSRADHSASRDAAASAAMTWLVSGNDVAATPPSFGPRQGVDTGESVEMAGSVQKPYHDGTYGAVQAPMVEVRDAGGRTVARYAYWVSDEGVKAPVNFLDDDSDDLSEIERQSMPWKSGLETLPKPNGSFDADPLLSGSLSDPAIRESLQKLLGLSNLSPTAAELSENELARFRHDLTTASQGILVDTIDGGLRRDLSFGLRTNAAAEDGAAPDNAQPIFPPQGLSVPEPGADPGGPLWGQLRDFANLRQKQPSGPDTLGARNWQANGEQIGVTPVLARTQLYLYATYVPEGEVPPSGTNGEAAWRYRVRLFLLPAAVLWNPYTVRLEGRDYNLHFGSGEPYHFGFSVGRINNNTWLNELNQEWQLNSVNFTLENPEGLDPGEARIFTPDAQRAFDENGDNGLAAGWRSGFGFYFDSNSFEIPASEYAPEHRPANVSDGQPLPPDGLDPEEPYRYAIDIGASDTHYALWTLLTPNRSALASRNRLQTLGTLSRGGLINSFPFNDSQWELSDDGPPTHYEPTAMADTNSNLPLFADLRDACGWTFTLKLPQLRHWNYPAIGDPQRERRRPLWSVFNPIGPRSTFNLDVISHKGPGGAFYFTNFNTIHTGNFKARPNNTDIETIHYQIQTTGGTEQAKIGFSDTGSSDEMVLLEFPEDPAKLTSIGELASAQLRPRYNRNTVKYFLHSELPLYMIGNSYAPPTIPSDLQADVRTLNNNVTTVYDMSYLLNQALWDDYFFSGTDYDDPSSDRPQPAFARASGSNGSFGYEEAAAELVQKAPFNVNSTSEIAWINLLSQFYEEDVTSKTGTVTFDDEESPLLRHRLPDSDTPYEPGNHTEESQEASNGFRALDRSYIRDLAQAIVREVKERGPFMGLADFINRSIDSDAAPEHRLKGALQAAIDSTADADSNFDYTINEGFAATLPNNELYPNPEAMALPVASGFPGYLMQSDILSRIGSQVTARSDTFTIHVYAETVNPLTGDVSSRRRGEAVVQRLPEWIDDSQQPSASPSGNLNPKFGRRFTVKGFTWKQ